MDIATLVVAILALIYARTASSRAAELEERLGDTRREFLGAAANNDDLIKDTAFVMKALEAMAAGRPLDGMMIREKRLYAQATVDALKARLEAGENTAVLDVRNAQEWAGGHIPGATHVPVDALESSLHQVPRDGTPLFVICAGGGRSSGAAEYLAGRGFLHVHNVQGGMSAWRGEVSKD